MPNDLKPNKNPRQKGLTGGRPNIVKYPENESNENREIEKIKTLDKMLNGGMFKKSATATASSGDGGSGGSDSSLMGLLGKSGILKSFKNKNVTYSGDTSDQTTGGQQTKQVIAKRMGGMIRGGRAEIKGTRPAKLT